MCQSAGVRACARVCACVCVRRVVCAARPGAGTCALGGEGGGGRHHNVGPEGLLRLAQRRRLVVPYRGRRWRLRAAAAATADAVTTDADAYAYADAGADADAEQ
jgi:hypothetical protein